MKTHLGDNVYVDLVHDLLKLTTEYRSDQPSNTIFLTIPAYRALVEYVTRLEAAK